MNSGADSAAGGPVPPSDRSQLAVRLAVHPFVTGMNPAHLAAFADYATATDFAPGQTIFKEGDDANCFYLLLDGCVALDAGFGAGLVSTIDRLGAGEVLGWSWLFPPYRWHFSARALEPTAAIFLYGTWLRARCDEDPVFAVEVMKRVSAVMLRRLQTTRQRLGRALRAAAD